MHLPLIKIAALLSTAVSFTIVSASPNAHSGHLVLRAAKRHGGLVARSDTVVLRNDLTLTYAEGKPQAASRLVSELKMHSERPSLLLDDIDHLLKTVGCTHSEMTIAFLQVAHYEQAFSEMLRLVNGLIVSSHATCSNDGEHAVYHVLDINPDYEYLRITVLVEKTDLNSAFTDITFDLYHTSEAHTVHGHDRLLPRQDSTPTATGMPPDQTLTGSLGFGPVLDTTFELEDQQLPFDIGCRNCTGTGQVTLEMTSVVVNSLFSGDDDPFEAGAILLDLTGFSLSIGLKASPEDESYLSFNVLKQNAIQGIDASITLIIEGVGHIGLDFEIDLEFQSTVAKSTELGFGFDITVPDFSIRADIAETQNSRVDNFSPTVTAQLLRSNVSDVELNMLAGLQFRFVGDIEILGVDFELGPFLTLPYLILNATQLSTSNVGSNCEGNGEVVQGFRDSYQNLTHVDYNVGIGGGMDIGFGDPITFTSTEYPLATQCLVYSTGGPSAVLAEATAVAAEIKAKGGASALGLPIYLSLLIVVLHLASSYLD